eukprot:jgi/Chlat1/8683/Chrsp88S08058
MRAAAVAAVGLALAAVLLFCGAALPAEAAGRPGRPLPVDYLQDRAADLKGRTAQLNSLLHQYFTHQSSSAIEGGDITGYAHDVLQQVEALQKASQTPHVEADAQSHHIKRLADIEDALPVYIASAIPGQQVNWSAPCFSNSTATIEMSKDGAALHLDLGNPTGRFCYDVYIFCTPKRFIIDFYFNHGKHTITLRNWQKYEKETVEAQGVTVFLLPAGLVSTARAFLNLYPLFQNGKSGERANLAFLETRSGAAFVERTPPYNIDLPKDAVHSGDFIVIAKYRGRWGGFESLERWVTGAYAGHSAVALWAEDGSELFVAESGFENEKGEEVIAVTQWDTWMAMQRNDVAEPHVAIIRLNQAQRERFNLAKAWEYARSMEGHPYGYHNIIFSWIDTPEANYPPGISAELIAAVMTIWDRVMPAFTGRLWTEALNKRLNTTGLDLGGVLAECAARGITFEELLAVPEQDDWEYSDGRSVTCNVFVLEMYKAAGLLGDLAPHVQATEFTLKDVYQIKLFDDNINNKPEACSVDPMPYCQLTGKWRMDLPGLNSIEPYPQMNEHCPSLPPDYDRPDNC